MLERQLPSAQSGSSYSLVVRALDSRGVDPTRIRGIAGRAEISVTKMLMIAVAPTMEQADADLNAMAAAKGWNADVVAMARRLLIFGDTDSVGEQIAEAMRHGIDGVALNLPANGHDPERIGLLRRDRAEGHCELGAKLNARRRGPLSRWGR